MSMILKQESDGSVPAPAAGKGTIYVNTSGELAVKKPDGTGGQVSYAAVANSVAVANVVGLGNIATVNLNGSSSQVLYGNGEWGAGGGTATALNATIANVHIQGGTNGQVLSTNGSGTLSWVSGGGGGGSPGGSDTQVQFNDAGSFGGDAGFTYDKANAMLTSTTATIGNIYYEDNIVSPIPTYVETAYGNVLVHTPLAVNSPLEVLSADTSDTTFFTLSGADLSGGHSGGTNNAGSYYTQGWTQLIFYSIPPSTTQDALDTIRANDELVCIGTNGFFTGSTRFRVTQIVKEQDYQSGAIYFIDGQYVSGDNPSSWNANIIQCIRPKSESTVAGGLNADYVNTSEVVTNQLIVNNALVTNTDAYIGALTVPGNRIYQTVNYFGGTALSFQLYNTSYYDVTLTGISSYGLTSFYFGAFQTNVQYGMREVNISIYPQDGALPVSFGSTWQIQISTPTFYGITFQNVPIHWDNGVAPTSFPQSRKTIITIKFAISGGGYEGAYASWKTYGF